MKRILAIAFAACITVTSCKKDNPIQDMITGKWELREELGGFSGKISYEPGNSTVRIFQPNKQFQIIYVNGPAIEGTYLLKTSARAGDYLLEMQYQVNGQLQARTDSVRFEKNQLLFLPFASCCDIPTSYYNRVW